MIIKNIDICSEFLHDPYDGMESLYILPITSFDGKLCHKGTVARIARNIYSTPDPQKRYMIVLQKHLQGYGYSRLKIDWSIYVKRDWITVTVYEFFFSYSHENTYQQLLRELSYSYQLKDMSDVSHLIGWYIVRKPNNGSLHISQPYLAQAHVNLLRMKDANPENSPYISGIKLYDVDETE